MPIVRLVYYSRACQDLTPLDIQRILQTARRHNVAAGVGGLLCYESPWFLQALEGERDTVNDLYLRIAADSRHFEVTLLDYGCIDSPAFDGWRRGYAGESAALPGILQTLGLPAFRPPDLDPAGALALLQRLGALQAVPA